MTGFDYSVEAELFPPRIRKNAHQRFGYRRFAQAHEAVRFAIEELPPELLLGAILEVDGVRYDGVQIRRLYREAQAGGSLERTKAASTPEPSVSS